MSKKPNVLIIGVDSLRRDHTSLDGYFRQTTPHIDKLFGESGTNFPHCFSPSIPTPPGYSALLTGRDCFGTGVVTLSNVPELPSETTTLQAILKAHGYTSTMVGFGDGPFTHGFDNFLSYPDSWGRWAKGRSHKAESLNSVAIPELKRLAAQDEPFFLFLRHMDPHSPYLPPAPFERMFYDGDEFDPNNKSLEGAYSFKPFCDYFYPWFPPPCTDSNYIDAQYDGAIAYMDSCIQNIFTTLDALGILDDTLIVFTSDHGETLNEHECYYDHHGTYDNTLSVPLALRLPGVVPMGFEFDDMVQQKDLVPTILDILGIDKSPYVFDGRSLMPLMQGEDRVMETEMYITEATWMRKHGWRTPEWKLIRALEPDFHFKKPVELYNLLKDPEELHNVADENPEVVDMLTKRMEAWIAKREKETGRRNPMYTCEYWHGDRSVGPFYTSSEQAYNSKHIGDPEDARKLQAQGKDK